MDSLMLISLKSSRLVLSSGIGDKLLQSRESVCLQATSDLVVFLEGRFPSFLNPSSFFDHGLPFNSTVLGHVCGS